MTLREGLHAMPASCFGQLSAEYVGHILITTFILDGNDWLVDCNITEGFDTELEADLGSKDIVVSSGTAGFIASMEEHGSEDSSDVDTVLDAASPEDLKDLHRLVMIIYYFHQVCQ